MPPKQREMSYSGVLSEGSPNIHGAKNPVAANETLQNNISQLIADFNQLKINGVDKQDFENLREDFQQLIRDRLDPEQFAEVRNDIQQLTEAVRDLGKAPSEDAFDALLEDVRQIGGKVETLTEKALEKAQLDDDETGSKAGEDDGNVNNNGTSAIDLHESPKNDLVDNLYHGFPQNRIRTCLLTPNKLLKEVTEPLKALEQTLRLIPTDLSAPKPLPRMSSFGFTPSFGRLNGGVIGSAAARSHADQRQFYSP